MGVNDIDCLLVVIGSFFVGMVMWNGLVLVELMLWVFDVEVVEVEIIVCGLLFFGDCLCELSDGVDVCVSCGEF